MIQRIQTVFIFVVVILQSILLMSNFVKFIDLQGEEHLYKTMDVMYVAVLTSLSALIPAVSLFMYKNRIRQLRFNIFNSILLVILQGFIVYYIIKVAGESSKMLFSLPSIFPAASFILSILAIRNILKDETLVRSLERFRK
jgi:hypothetical protein